MRNAINQEISDIRTKSQAAQVEAANLEAQAVALEQKLAAMPAEVESLAEEAAQRLWAWIKGL